MELRRLHRQPNCTERVVGLVLDRGPLEGARLHRLRVCGPAELPSMLARNRVGEVTLVPPASASFVGTIQKMCVAHGVPCRSSASLLALGELLSSPEQLLNRAAPESFDSSVRRTIEGRTVLVTGAGGSIGSELCRQLMPLHPSRLVLVNRSENGLFHAERTLRELDDERHGDRRARASTCATPPPCSGCSRACAPTRCFTPPRTSTCRSWSAIRARRRSTTSAACASSPRPPVVTVPSCSSSSRPTRRFIRRA